MRLSEEWLHHYSTKHAHFEQNCPQNMNIRTIKLNQLKLSYQAREGDGGITESGMALMQTQEALFGH